MTKEKRNKLKKLTTLIAIVLIVIGVFVNLYDFYIDYKANIKEEKSVETFLNKEYDATPTEIKKSDDTINYIGVIEIPSINLKKGFVDPNSYLNNVNLNIEILKPVAFPNEEKSNFILASHSGSCNVCHFTKLKDVRDDDLIYIYYDSVKYTYKVIDKYERKKDGTLSFSKNPDDTTLTLVTCSTIHKDMQLYVIAKQISNNKY